MNALLRNSFYQNLWSEKSKEYAKALEETVHGNQLSAAGKRSVCADSNLALPELIRQSELFAANKKSALAYLYGENVQQSFVFAVHYLNKVVNQALLWYDHNLPPEQQLYRDEINDGIQTYQNVRQYLEDVMNESGEASYVYALTCLGMPVAESEAQAVQQFMEIVESNLSVVDPVLRFRYEPDVCYDFLEQAARQGNASAAWVLSQITLGAVFYNQGNPDTAGLDVDCAKNGESTHPLLWKDFPFGYVYMKSSALDWLKVAAKNGHPQALRELGVAHLTGELVEKNVEEGMRLLNQAVEKGDELASSKLAQFYKD